MGTETRQTPIMQQAGTESRPMERRRLPRIHLSTEQFRLASSGKIYSVLDVSSGGMAIRIIEANDLHQFAVGTRVEGSLRLRGVKWPVHAKVRHCHPERVGFEWVGLDPQVREALSEFIDPHVLGKTLRAMPAGDQASIWYHGASGTELFYWRGLDGRTTRFLVMVQGQFIEWSEESLKTGYFEPSGDRTEKIGALHLHSLCFYPDEALDSEKIQIAKTLLLSSKLPENLRIWSVRSLANS